MKYFILLVLHSVFLQAATDTEIISLSISPEIIDIKQPFEISVVVFDTSSNFVSQNHKIFIYFEGGSFIAKDLYFNPELNSNYFKAEHSISLSNIDYEPAGFHPIAILLNSHSNNFWSSDLQALGMEYQIKLQDDALDQTAPELTSIIVEPIETFNKLIEFTLEVFDIGYGLSQNSEICYYDVFEGLICSSLDWNFTSIDNSGAFLAKKYIYIPMRQADATDQLLISLNLIDLFGNTKKYESYELSSFYFNSHSEAVFEGCTNPDACNYDSTALVDDGSCEYYSETYFDCFGSCFLEEGCSLIDYCIDLNIGANLISFHSLPDDVSVSNILNTLGESVHGILSSKHSAIQFNSQEWIGSLMSIERDQGYWILMKDSLNNSLCFENAKPSIALLNYSIKKGSNLISFPAQGSVSINDALPDSIELNIESIRSERSASVQLSPGIWAGSLVSFNGGKGYWLNSNSELSFSFDFSNLSRQKKIHKNQFDRFEYNQSYKNSFYFFESIEGINYGDYILAYHGDKLIGVQEWQGSIIEVPVMGYDGNSYSDGYIEDGSIPSFKLFSDGQLTLLDGDIPAWSENRIFIVSNLSKIIPEEYILNQAYPNPFNPRTSLSFTIPENNEVTLSIYNLQGREVATLIEGNMSAGYHSVVWDANAYSSGVYFARMVAGNYKSTQKLVLVK
tara:strand:- start:2178 stop:4211 length:2034 start_codon:yes stop_codon:yes gene_type:complete